MAAKLVSLKMTKKEAEDRYTVGPEKAADAPIYPWGLSINLDNDTIEKLNLGTLPDVGESYLLLAKCKVTSISSNDSESGKNRSMGLQITDLAFDVGEESNKAASRLYNGDKAVS